MSIAGMIVWILTAGIGIYVLAAGMAAQRQLAGAGRPGDHPGPPSAGAGLDALAQSADGATVVGAAALASVTAPERRTTVAGSTVAGPAVAGPGSAAAAGGSPLLEFTHPLLAITGLMFWIFFVMTNYRLFAWLAFGVVVAAVLAGFSWAVIGRRAARRTARPANGDAGNGDAGNGDAGNGDAGNGDAGNGEHTFPAHLVMIHGLAAACTLALVVISAVTAAHG